MTAPIFYQGTHKPGWLWRPDVRYRLCVSYASLRSYVNLNRATDPWILDSSSYSMLNLHGEYQISPREYLRDVARYQREIGNLVWAAPQDWMCEDHILAKTGLTEWEHLERTVENFLELTVLWPHFSDLECPLIPAVQGSDKTAHIKCVGLYGSAGVKLNTYPAVGIGSVCQLTDPVEIHDLFRAMTICGRTHGFGVKSTAVQAAGKYMVSCDSASWSYDARRNPPMYLHAHKSCANCQPYAQRHQRELKATIGGGGPVANLHIGCGGLVDSGTCTRCGTDWLSPVGSNPPFTRGRYAEGDAGNGPAEIWTQPDTPEWHAWKARQDARIACLLSQGMAA